MVPTQKQREVFDRVVNKKQDFRKAMLEVGYSESSSHNPGNVLVSKKGWQMLVDEYLPESELVRVHKEGLNATRKIQVDKELIDIEDYQTRHKYLETGYKIRGRMAIKEDTTPTVNINIGNFLTKVYGRTSTGEVSDNS